MMTRLLITKGIEVLAHGEQDLGNQLVVVKWHGSLERLQELGSSVAVSRSNMIALKTSPCFSRGLFSMNLAE